MTSIWLDGADTPSDDSWPTSGVDVAVVGAGLTGLTTAVLLARGGSRVAVVEGRTVGAAATGNTTAKVSLLQGTTYSSLLRRHPLEVVQAYVEVNRAGADWVREYCESQGLVAQSRTATTFALTDDELPTAEAEHEAALRAGLPVVWSEGLPVPFPVKGATNLADQLQIDPVLLLHALVDELRSLGGTLHQHARLTGVRGGRSPVAQVEGDRRIAADHVVLATGTPVLDRGLHFARLSPMRSYGLAFTGVEPPEGMLLSAGSSSVSIRDLPRANGSRSLLVGGAGHEVGRTSSPRSHVDQLRAWTAEHFPGARETHVWSAQDYESHDLLPVVGPLPGSRGRVHVATGFRKWGMTNGVAAAHQLAADLLGGSTPWGDTLRRRRPRVGDLGQLASINAHTGVAAVTGFAAAERTAAPKRPAPGDGGVGRGSTPVPVGRANVEGQRCSVVALCTHLGGPLRWNDQERSWDCTLHGSRFAADGAVLEGPATRALRQAGADGDGSV